MRHGVRLPECDAIEEAQGTGDLIDVRPRALLADEVELVGADLLRAEPRRRRAEVTTKLRDRVDIGLLRRRREIAQRHVLDHTLTKRAHRGHLGLLS